MAKKPSSNNNDNARASKELLKRKFKEKIAEIENDVNSNVKTE